MIQLYVALPMTSIAELNERIARHERRIERWQSKPLTERRERRIAKAQWQIARLEERIAHKELEAAKEEDTFMKDSFKITFKPADGDIPLDRFEVVVFDSPLDDTYSSSDPLAFRLSAKGWRTPRGTKSFASTRVLSDGSEEWDYPLYNTFVVGDSLWSGLGNYEDVTAYVVKDTGERPLFFNTDEILGIQTIT